MDLTRNRQGSNRDLQGFWIRIVAVSRQQGRCRSDAALRLCRRASVHVPNRGREAIRPMDIDRFRKGGLGWVWVTSRDRKRCASSAPCGRSASSEPSRRWLPHGLQPRGYQEESLLAGERGMLVDDEQGRSCPCCNPSTPCPSSPVIRPAGEGVCKRVRTFGGVPNGPR